MGDSMSTIINATTTNGVVIQPDNSGSLALQTNSGTTALTIDTSQNATFAAQATIPTINLTGGQITFPATQSSSANANCLDDYEEGTWTPTNPVGGYTFSSVTGSYTKIGRMVYVNCNLTFSAVNASSNSSCTFTGLPFAVANTTAGIFRDDTSTGAVYVFRVSPTVNAEINSMDGVASGSQRTIRINETYKGFAVYEV
jgi:hypothetical protein